MGVNFTLWAPHASRVSVVGTFNQWDGRRHLMERHESGVWELFIPGIGSGELYKYEIRNGEGAVFLKTDPLAFQTEAYPSTAALVYDLQHRYTWTDGRWMARTLETPGWEWPVAVHRVTFGANPDQAAGYAQLKEVVLPYLLERKFTHVELSFWTPSETVAGYFTPNPRYGRPEELMAFIDACHQRDIGVILDWIPALIPCEGQELTWFDGTRIYDVDVPGQPGMLAFNVERPEVRNILAANARFWRQVYHVDALRTEVRTLVARMGQPDRVDGLRFLLRDDAPPLTLNAAERDALVQGRHTHPHVVLGPHPSDEAGLTIVRAFLPDAESPWLLPENQRHLLYSLLPIYAGGLFETLVAAEPEHLRYQINAIEHGQARWRGSTASISRSGRRMPSGSAWSARSITGMAVVIPCACGPVREFGNCSSPIWRRASCTSLKSWPATVTFS